MIRRLLQRVPAISSAAMEPRVMCAECGENISGGMTAAAVAHGLLAAMTLGAGNLSLPASDEHNVPLVLQTLRSRRDSQQGSHTSALVRPPEELLP